MHMQTGELVDIRRFFDTNKGHTAHNEAQSNKKVTTKHQVMKERTQEEEHLHLAIVKPWGASLFQTKYRQDRVQTD